MPIYLRIVTLLIVFFFPTVANLVEHAGSTMITVLMIIGIVAWSTRKTKPAFDQGEKIILWSFAAYFLVSFIFYIGHSFFKENFSLYRELAHWELNHEARFLVYIPIYYLFYRAGLKQWLLWYGAATAAIISGIYSVIYIYGLSAGQRATGAYHPIAFGDISLLMGFISLSGIRYFQEKHKALMLIPILAVFSGMLVCFLSGTRIAVLTIPFLTLIFFIQLGTFRRPWLYRSVIILTIIIMSAAFYHLPKSSLEYRIRAGISDAKSFFKGDTSGLYAVHLSMWAQGWEIFSKHPLLGVGPNGYEEIIKQKAAAGQIPAEIEQFNSPHNMYLMNMTAYGIFGLLILLAVFLSPLLTFFPASKKPWPARDISYAGFMLICGFMLFGATESIFIRNININFYIILMAAIVTLTKQFQCETISKQ